MPLDLQLTPAPAPKQPESPPVVAQGDDNWKSWLGLISFVTLCFLFLAGLIILAFKYDDGDHKPGPQGRYAIIWEDVEKRLGLNDQQKIMFQSVEVRKACEELKVKFRILDAQEDLRNDSPELKALQQQAKGPFPSLMIANGGKVKETYAPEDASRLIQVIEGEFE